MKVLKTPEEMAPKVEWTKEVQCPMCGALLEYNNLDIQSRMTYFNELQKVVICGHCHKWFAVG